MSDLNYVVEFHEAIDRSKVMLSYDGVLSKDIVSAFLNRLKEDIEAVDVPKKEKKRFFSIVVECIQNLSKHGNVSDLNDSHFLVLVEKENKTLKVSTGNIIPNESQTIIARLINQVNDKNELELRQMYREGIARNTLSKRGEASLGLIDIARKSSDKIKYQFNQIDEQSSFFVFQTQVHINH